MDQLQEHKLIAKGFMQRPNLNYSKLYDYIARTETDSLLIVISNVMWWPIIFNMTIRNAWFIGQPMNSKAWNKKLELRTREYMDFNEIVLQ